MAPMSLYFLLFLLEAHFEYVVNMISWNDTNISQEDLNKEVDEFMNAIEEKTGEMLKYAIQTRVKQYLEKKELLKIQYLVKEKFLRKMLNETINLLEKADKKIENLVKNETRLIATLDYLNGYVIDRYCESAVRTSLETLIPKNVMNPSVNYEERKTSIHKAIENKRAARKTELEIIALQIGELAHGYLTAVRTTGSVIPHDSISSLRRTGQLHNQKSSTTSKSVKDFKEEFKNIVTKFKKMNITMPPGPIDTIEFLHQIVLLKDMVNPEMDWDYWKANNAQFWEHKYQTEWTNGKLSESDTELIKRTVYSLTGLDIRRFKFELDVLSYGELNYTLHYMSQPINEEYTDKYTQCMWLLLVETKCHFQSVLRSVMDENRNKTRSDIWKNLDRHTAIHKVCWHFALLYDSAVFYSRGDGPRLPDSICPVHSEHFKKYLLQLAGNDPMREDVACALLKICPIST